MARLFISHSAHDNAEAVAIRDWLFEQGFSDDVFLDIDAGHGIAAGDRWQDELKKAADRCESVLAVLTQSWLASKWCFAEFQLAKLLHKRIIGLLVEPLTLDRLPEGFDHLYDLTDQSDVQFFEVSTASGSQRVALGQAGLARFRRGLHRAEVIASSFV